MEFSREVQAMLKTGARRAHRGTESHIAEDQAELAELEPQPVKMANPSTPKYRDPAKPVTGPGVESRCGLKEKIEAAHLWMTS